MLDDHGDPVGTADALEAVGAIAARGRNVEQAARLLGAAERLRQETGIDRFPRRHAGPGALGGTGGGPAVARHVMLMMTVFLWVKCSSIDSSEASRPRPDCFVPP